MTYLCGKTFSRSLKIALFSLALAVAPLPVRGQQIYSPIPIKSDGQIADRLSEQDIPTGEGGFAKDYAIQLQKGDQVAKWML